MVNRGARGLARFGHIMDRCAGDEAQPPCAGCLTRAAAAQMNAVRAKAPRICRWNPRNKQQQAAGPRDPPELPNQAPPGSRH